MRYLDYDREIVGGCLFRILGFAGAGNEAGSIRSIDIPFQFRPRIVGDNKSLEWNEVESSAIFAEPSAQFKKINPRAITLNFEYLVDGDKWTTTRVSQTIKVIRAYLSRPVYFFGSNAGVDFNDKQSSLIVDLKLWAIGGAKEMSARIENVNVTYSENLIIPTVIDNRNYYPDQLISLEPNQSSRAVDYAYPLKTEVSLGMKIWPKQIINGNNVGVNLEGLKILESGWW